MSKTISWPTRVIYIVLALALALSVAMAALPKAQVGADPGTTEWTDVSTPNEDKSVILPGSDILSFDMGPDGDVIYAVVASGGGDVGDMLFKSTDAGATWSDKTGKLPTGFDSGLILVSVAPDDADFVVVATGDEVCGSNDGGNKFHDTGFLGGAETILCLDVSSERSDEHNIAVGTSDGVIYRFVAGGYWGGQWKAAMPTDITGVTGTWWVDVDGPGSASTTGNTPATALPTILGALTKAAGDGVTGSTIYVMPGDYAPGATLIITEAGLTLKSTDGPDSTIIDGSGIVDVISIQNAADVTVEGFTVDKGNTNGIGIYAYTGAAGATIANNVVTDSLNVGISVGCLGADANVTISGNRVEDCYCGVLVAAESGASTIEDNIITGSTATTVDGGITLNGDNGDITIRGNTITDSDGSGIYFKDSAGTYDNNLIEGNTISGNAGAGIDIAEATDAPTGLVITGNDITGNGSGGILIASWSTTNAVNNNNISGNTGYGIENTPTPPTVIVDAENNWWGDETGPYHAGSNPAGLGNDVTNDVDYRPFLDAAVTVAPTVIPAYDTVSTTGVGGYAGWKTSTAVTSVVFSPDWSSDKTVLAITDAYLQTGKWGTKKGWNTEVNYPPAVKLTDETPTLISGIALPSDYSGFDAELRTSWVFAKDIVYRVENNVPEEFCPTSEQELASIAFHGTIEDGGKLMLGVLSVSGDCEGVQVFRTDEVNICCPDWKGATKKPSGGSNTLVAFTPDGKKAYAVTQGDESAFSVSLDDGKCWNQLSLIDTDISSLSDVAVSPDCSVTYLSSMNGDGCDSVWMKDANATEYAGVWQRVFHKALGGDGLLRLSPEHEDGDVVYWGDQGHKNLYWAESKGICRWSSRTTTLAVQDFAIADDDTIYVIDDGGDISAFVWGTHDWSPEEDTKVDVGHSVAVLGDYILVGGEDGKVSYSDDAGDSFTALDSAGEVDVHVAFDSYFEDNGVVYAASDSIYRCSDLEDGEWTDFKSTTQNYYGIVLDNAAENPMTDADTGGVLYAVYDGGMARVLGAVASKDEDYLDNGLVSEEFTAEPGALRICDSGNTLLWAIDTSGYDLTDGKDNLFVYEDCLSKVAVELSEVKDGAVIPSDPCFCQNDKFILNWDDLCNSSDYELEIALDEDFDFVVNKYDPAPVDDEHKLVAKGDLDCNETYYWRVRVVEADGGHETIRSWWSDARSFTVQAGPMGAIQLTAPGAGATDVAIEGVAFTWTSVAEVTGYDFALMDASGAAVDSKTGLTSTAYAYDGTLDNDTPYTWKVTAMKDGSVLSESSLSTFTTAAAPAAAVWTCAQCGLTFPSEAALKAHIAEAHAPAEPAGTPAWVWVVIAIGAVLVITVIVLIFRTRRI